MPYTMLSKPNHLATHEEVIKMCQGCTKSNQSQKVGDKEVTVHSSASKELMNSSTSYPHRTWAEPGGKQVVTSAN